MEDQSAIEFLDGIDPENINKETWNKVNTLFGEISTLTNFKYHLLIYKLIRMEIVGTNELSRVTGLSNERISKIVTSFGEKMTERRANETV